MHEKFGISNLFLSIIKYRNPLEEETLTGDEGHESDSEYDDDTTLTASTVMSMNEGIEYRYVVISDILHICHLL